MSDAFMKIPLDRVAPDMRGAIRLFREAGEVSFQSLPVETSREAYVRGCRANGLPPVDLPRVRDHAVAVAGGEITVREYRPLAAAGAVLPAVLFLHGGGWVIGDLNSHDGLCRAIAAQSGAAVFAVDYRRAPEYPFPVPLDDCAAALSWICDGAEALGIDLRRVAAVGDSAGGNLCAVLANEGGLRPEGFAFAALGLLYPVTALHKQLPSYQKIASGFPLSAASMEWFRDLYLPSGQDAADPRISPLLATHVATAPLFIVTCGLDPLCDEGIAYAGKVAQAGGRIEHHHLPGHAHGLFTSAGIIATGQKMAARLTDFLARQFRLMEAFE